MQLFLIFLLVVVGLFLIVAEILILPGITLAAIGAIVAFVGALIWTYSLYGLQWTMILLFACIVLIALTLYLSVRSKTLRKITLESNIDSVANVKAEQLVSVGSVGETVTRLAPMGTVLINGHSLEAKSLDGYIVPRTEIEVAGYENTVVLVKLKND